MMHLLTSPATARQLTEMLAGGDAIRLAVDVELEIVAGGGELHADAEAVLVAAGSDNDHVWGATWVASTREVRFTSVITSRPRLGQLGVEIGNRALRERVERIVRSYLVAP